MITPVWVSALIIDTVLVLLWFSLPSFWLALLIALTAFYVFQAAILINNALCKRYNVINVWQFTPACIGALGVILTLAAYLACFAFILYIYTTTSADLLPSSAATTKLVVAKVIVSINLLLLLTGSVLYFYTAFRVIVKGERSYEMLPVPYPPPEEEPAANGTGPATRENEGSSAA